MTDEDFNRKLQEFADEFGMELDTLSPFEKIWDFVVGFLAMLGFVAAVIGLLALGAWMDGV